MKVKVQDIKEDGLELNKTLLASEIGLAEDRLFKCLTPFKIAVKLEKVNNTIIGNAVVNGRVELLCARCSEPIEQDRTEKFDLYFEINPEIEYIDIGEDIRQEMFIDLCSIVVCRSDCKGICSLCGANLNNEPCRCRN